MFVTGTVQGVVSRSKKCKWCLKEGPDETVQENPLRFRECIGNKESKWFKFELLGCVHAQLHPTSLGFHDCSLAGLLSVGFSQCKSIGGAAISSSQGIFPPSDRTHISPGVSWALGRHFFFLTTELPGSPL